MYQPNINSTQMAMMGNPGYPMGTGVGAGPAMGMGAGMNFMGFGIGAGTGTNGFFYSGNAIGLQTRLQGINPQQLANVRQASIICSGTQISQMNMCCILCTTIWGALIIFPLFFMCCDWWKRIAYASFNIPQITYQNLQKLISSASNLQSLSLSVVDNRLNKQKAQILYDLLSRSRLKGFTLINSAMHFDLESDEYSNFEDNFKILKKLPIISQIKWMNKLVL